MDTSEHMDSLDDSSILPELSFDDLLDPSPIKKSSKLRNDEEYLDFSRNETLNTPGPKKPPIFQKNTSTTAIAGGSKMTSTPFRSNTIKTGINTNTIVNVAKNSATNNISGTSGPVLLNTKNVLPKTATQIPSSSIKLARKTPNVATNVSFAGKTAVRTSNGQIIYIQKNPTVSGNVKPGTTSTVVANSQSSHAGSTSGAKPMTIQVLRTAEGNYVPLKTTSGGSTNTKNTTLTLSPTSLAGRKIISSTGGQVLIKSSLKTTDTTATGGANTITTSAISGVKTMVRPSTSTSASTGQGVNQKSIFLQGSNGKQIIVSNQNIVKLSPKPQTTTNTSTGASGATTSTANAGQVHAIQIPGKLGVQYVRVLPNTKVAGKPITTTATSTTPSSLVTTKSLASSQHQPVKILNTSMPQKFTVLQKGTKVVVTQKKDTDFSPIASKVQKTIVTTVPTFKSLNDDKSKPLIQQQQHSQIRPQQTIMSSSQNLMRKHKISEINSEIQRITTNTSNNDNAVGGPPEIKKPTPNNRVVVISNQPKILNNSIQQPGRLSTTATTASGGSMVQGTKIAQINPQTSSNNNKLYTILKPGSTFEQKNTTKLYSVLKPTTGNTATTSSASPSTSSLNTSTANAPNKPLINKQYLIQQQQKILQLKKQHLENSMKSFKSTIAPSSSSSTPSNYGMPIRIKEEPMETATAVEAAASSSSNSSLPPLGSSTVSNSEDQNKLDSMAGGVRRKHCNCSKSQCLKLYCDCFANGEFCQDCTCRDCFNNLQNEDERQRAIKSCLERNPSAFKPKITSSAEIGDMRLHNKGCNCKRSGCLKNYCECYEAKIPCSSNCKCVGCRNVEDRPDLDMDPVDPKLLASMANVSSQNNTQKRTYLKSHRDLTGSGGPGGVAIKTEKFSKDGGKSINSSDIMGAEVPLDSSQNLEKQQCNFITQEVVDATIQCMITQADECEKNGLPSYQMEKMVMEELGRCLVEIIDFSIRNTDNSYSQD